MTKETSFQETNGRGEKNSMSDISDVASSAMAMSLSNLQQKIEMTMLRKNALADQEVADMILENAKRVQELSEKSSSTIDLFV